MPPSLAWFRDLGTLLVTRLCHLPEIEAECQHVDLPIPHDELHALAAAAPPFAGAEYLTAEVMDALWADALVALREQLAAERTTVGGFLRMTRVPAAERRVEAVQRVPSEARPATGETPPKVIDLSLS